MASREGASWLDEYEPVAARIPKYWSDHPGGRLITLMHAFTDIDVIVECQLFRADEMEPFATGWAHEKPGQGQVNRQAVLENCETSAIGRALANAGYASAHRRPSREEMAKVARRSHAPKECAACGEPLAGHQVAKVDDGYIHVVCPIDEETAPAETPPEDPPQ